MKAFPVLLWFGWFCLPSQAKRPRAPSLRAAAVVPHSNNAISEEGAFSFSGIFSYTPKGPYERPANSLLCNCQCIINRTHVNQDFVYPVPKIQRSPHVDAAAAANRYVPNHYTISFFDKPQIEEYRTPRAFSTKTYHFLVHFFYFTEFPAFTKKISIFSIFSS